MEQLKTFLIEALAKGLDKARLNYNNLMDERGFRGVKYMRSQAYKQCVCHERALQMVKVLESHEIPLRISFCGTVDVTSNFLTAGSPSAMVGALAKDPDFAKQFRVEFVYFTKTQGLAISIPDEIWMSATTKASH